MHHLWKPGRPYPRKRIACLIVLCLAMAMPFQDDITLASMKISDTFIPIDDKGGYPATDGEQDLPSQDIRVQQGMEQGTDDWIPAEVGEEEEEEKEEKEEDDDDSFWEVISEFEALEAEVRFIRSGGRCTLDKEEKDSIGFFEEGPQERDSTPRHRGSG